MLIHRENASAFWYNGNAMHRFTRELYAQAGTIRCWRLTQRGLEIVDDALKPHLAERSTAEPAKN